MHRSFSSWLRIGFLSLVSIASLSRDSRAQAFPATSAGWIAVERARAALAVIVTEKGQGTRPIASNL